MFHYTIPDFLKESDAEIYSSLFAELRRQEQGIELIASENYVSESVMAAMGSVLTNKYAEGYPGKRYYGGCVHVDTAETIAIERLRELFQCNDSSANPYHANVQPHSGAQANMAVFLSVLSPGDKILGLNLSHGGHLTHGSPANFSGKLFEAHHYGVDENSELLNYETIAEMAEKIRPKMIIGGASAYSRLWDFEKLAKIAKNVGAFFLVDMAHIAGLVAAGIHPSPIPHADFVTSTTHKTLRGPRGGVILCKPNFAKQINSAVFPGMQGGPLMHVIAAKAVSFGEALTEDFRNYQKQIVKNAKALEKALVSSNIRLVSGGTDNHLLLLDVGALGLTGKEVEQNLDAVHVTVNKNTIPFEKRSPFITSGIRIGSPAVTSRGMKESEMTVIAEAISRVCADLAGQPEGKRSVSMALKSEISSEILSLCEKFPIYR